MAISFQRASACTCDSEIKAKISTVFVEGFGKWLQFFSKDSGKLTRAFTHMFNLDAFYVALDGAEVAAITACTDGKASCVHLEQKELVRHLGFFGGRMAFAILRNQLENHPYPFQLEQDTGSIEYVATAARYRGQGIALALISHIMAETPYRSYVLEVADTNTGAVRLYEKLGFTEFMRVKEKHSKQSGVNYLVYMRHDA